MVELKGSNECYYCGNSINWESRFNVPSGVPFILNGTQADVIAVGNENTMTGKVTNFEILVSCPKCKLKNKFEFTTK